VVIIEVFYILNLKSNLLSIAQLQQRELSILIHKGCCGIYHNAKGLIIRTMIIVNCMFILLSSIPPYNTTSLWHQRFRHLNIKELCTMTYKRIVHGLHI